MNIRDLLKSYFGKTVILVDLSWFNYKSYWALKDMCNFDGVPTGHFYMLGKFMRTIFYKYRDYLVLFVRDGIPIENKTLNENYKANRESAIEFYKDDTIMEQIIQPCPFAYIVWNPREEADDVMYSISRIKDYENNFIIYSGDNDLMQSIDSTTCISRSITDKGIDLITEQSAYYIDKFKDLKPANIPYYRAVIGDSSDNLKAISPRFPREIAKLFAEKCNPETGELPKLEDFGEEAKSMSDTKKKRLIEVCELPEAYLTNLKIMKLSEVETPLVHKNHTTQDILKSLDYYELLSLKGWYRQQGWL